MSSGARRRRRLRSVVKVFLRGKKRKKNSVSLSLSLSGEIVEFVFRPLFSFRFPSSALVRSRLLTRALFPLSLSLSDYHRSKSTRSLSKRWCVLFSMIRFCFFFCSLALSILSVSVCQKCMCERESVFFQSRVFHG